MNESQSVALTKNPLSRAFTQRLEQEFGKLSFLSVTELQRAGVSGFFRALRSVRAQHVLVPVEEDGAQWLVQALQLLAGIPKARTRELVYGDLRRDPFTRWRLVPVVGGFVWSSVANAFWSLLSYAQLSYLQRAGRVAAESRTAGDYLYINANLWFGVKAGGSVGHISGVINALIRRGSRVTFSACGGRLMVSKEAEYVELLPPSRFGVPLELNNYRFHHGVVRQLSKFISKTRDRPDVIYQRLSTGSFGGVSLSRRYKVPLVTEYNGSEAWVAKNWGRPLRFHSLALQAEDVQLRHSHIVVTVSDVLRDELIQRHVPADRIVVYPNCIDPAMFEPAAYSVEDRLALRAKFGLAADDIVITFVGTFGQWHGVDILARAIRTLVDTSETWMQQKRVHFLLIGDGLKMSEVRTILSTDRCRRFVTLVGLVPQPEAPSYLAASDLLVSPHVKNPDGTRFFGSPTKLFEYMAMGKGIVASDLDQIGDVLRDSLRVRSLPVSAPSGAETDLAVLAEPGSIEDLIAGIRFLVEQDRWREVLGRNARREALSKYTWAHHVQAMVRGLERACAPH